MVGGESIPPETKPAFRVKLLHVVASYLPASRYGGTIHSVHGLCRALAARGHDVHVFTTSVDGDRDSDVDHDRPVDVDGVSVRYFRSRYARRLYWSPALGRALRASIGDFDVVHTHAIYLWPLWTAARHAAGANVPYVVSPRGMLEKALIESRSPLQKALLIGMVERRVLENAAAIHVTSRREAEEAAAFGFNLPTLVGIPNGVTTDEDRPGTPSAAVGERVAAGGYALFLGRINWKKGLDRLSAALALVADLRLIIAGPDEHGFRETVQRWLRDHGVEDRTTFVGAVCGADKAALLSNAEMLVLPSYSENFGNVVLEAMAVGCPVVVTAEVGIADLVQESAAGLVVSGEPSQLAGAMASLHRHPATRRELGERGRAIARERFGWDVIAARMETLYETVRRSRDAQ